MKYNREYSSMQNVRQTLSKDLTNKKLTGVCSGIAKHYGYSSLIVRIVTVIAFLTLPVVTGVAYLTASLLLPSNRN